LRVVADGDTSRPALRFSTTTQIYRHACHEMAVQPEPPTSLNQAGKPWLNGFVSRFNGRLRDECLSRKCFVSRQSAKSIIEFG
jgi:transposase InsO family protein